MIDSFGRVINYLRVSLTDRCNMRCRYCRPAGVASIGRDAILRYEELLEICRAAVQCGVTQFKVTGGEPFVRKGALDFIAALKAVRGVESLTVTTNGLLLRQYLPELERIGVDGVNISLDTLDRRQFCAITGIDALDEVLDAVRKTAASSIRTKVNAVLLDDTRNQVAPLASLAESMDVDVRFIEVMPIGFGRYEQAYGQDEALSLLRNVYADLAPFGERRGNGPAVYYKSRFLRGRIGFIAANTHSFCSQCNRMRLTSTGFLKPCLCYPDGIDLRAIVRSANSSTAALAAAFGEAAAKKPRTHRFGAAGGVIEDKTMNQIGG